MNNKERICPLCDFRVNSQWDLDRHLTTHTPRDRALYRDNYSCQICDQSGNVIHHLDGNNQNNSLENLVTLCGFCHRSLEGRKTSVVYKNQQIDDYSLFQQLKEEIVNSKKEKERQQQKTQLNQLKERMLD